MSKCCKITKQQCTSVHVTCIKMRSYVVIKESEAGLCGIPEVPTWAASHPTKVSLLIWARHITSDTQNSLQWGHEQDRREEAKFHLPNREANPGHQTVSCFSTEMSESICEKLQRTSLKGWSRARIHGADWRDDRSVQHMLILLFTSCVCQQSKSLMKANNVLQTCWQSCREESLN